jgi:hypothetical protein
VAYNAVVNPLFVQLPNVTELMPTATNFKSAYGRAQLALVPPRPKTSRMDVLNIKNGVGATLPTRAIVSYWSGIIMLIALTGRGGTRAN